jgi:hypothetical protein
VRALDELHGAGVDRLAGRDVVAGHGHDLGAAPGGSFRLGPGHVAGHHPAHRERGGEGEHPPQPGLAAQREQRAEPGRARLRAHGRLLRIGAGQAGKPPATLVVGAPLGKGAVEGAQADVLAAAVEVLDDDDESVDDDEPLSELEEPLLLSEPAETVEEVLPRLSFL